MKLGKLLNAELRLTTRTRHLLFETLPIVIIDTTTAYRVINTAFPVD